MAQEPPKSQLSHSGLLCFAVWNRAVSELHCPEMGALRLDLIRGLVAGVVLVSAATAQPSPQVTLQSMAASGTFAELRWPDFSQLKTHVTNFYGPSGYAPAWTRNGAPSPQAQALILILQHAETKGLDPEDYDASRWAARLALLRPAVAKPAERDLDTFDLALTVSGMRFISDLRMGRVNPKVFCFGLDTDQKKCDLADSLRRLATSGDVPSLVAGLEPPFPATGISSRRCRRISSSRGKTMERCCRRRKLRSSRALPMRAPHDWSGCYVC